MLTTPNLDNSNNWGNVNNDGNVNNNNTNNDNGVAPELCIGGYQIMQNGTVIKYSDEPCSNKSSGSLNAIFSYEHLYNSYLKAIIGVKWKPSTQQYMVNACCRIARLYNELKNREFRNGKTNNFKVCERGKTREISALSLKDRIVHKCLCDYYLTPLLTKSLIHDCGATLKGKGLAFTRKRVVCHLQRYYRQNGNNKGYVLKADFHHYFESIKHDILINQLSKIVKDKETLEFVKYLIPTDLKGLGLGSQMSQICALYYVSKLDHYLKEKMRFKFYGRYMDDIYIISHHKNKLYKAKTYLKGELQKLGVELNENKTHIYSLDKGFVFCKTRYKLTESGKVLKLIASKTLSSFNRKAKNGHNIIPSKLGYYMQFNCYRLAL